MKDMETAALIDLYVQAAQRYEDAILRASSRDANRQHTVVERVFQELERRGAERELLPLLSHAQAIVREAAAVYALRFAPELAEPVLEELARGTGVAAANAMTSLQSWRERTHRS